MARSPRSQGNHDWMVLQVAEEYQIQGHRDIRADHTKHLNGAPSRIGDHIPDVTATRRSDNVPIICEVETSDSIGTEHTLSQLLTFREAATRLGGLLHVALPFKSDIVAAQAKVAAWGIPVDYWWYGSER